MRFNTSHVVVYHFYFCVDKFDFLSFNTSHVVVYPRELVLKNRENLFQYISCCCLSFYHLLTFSLVLVSIHLMLLFIGIVQERRQEKNSFNTSHVVVYHLKPGK